MSYASFTMPVPYRNLQGIVTGVYRYQEPILRVSVISPASGQPMPGKAWLSTERFYTADSRNAVNYVGKRVELQDINGNLTIMRILPEPNQTEPAEIAIGNNSTTIDEDGIIVAGETGEVVITPDSMRIEYDGAIGFTAEAGKATMQGGASQLVSVGHELIAGAAQQDLSSQIHYQIMLFPLTATATIPVYDTANNMQIGVIRRLDIAERSDLLVVAESGLVGGDRTPGTLDAPAMPGLTAVAGPVFNYSFTPVAGLFYQGLAVAHFRQDINLFGVGIQLDLNRPRRLYNNHAVSPVPRDNPPWPESNLSDDYITVYNNGGLLAPDALFINNGAAATTAGNGTVTVSQTGIVTATIPGKWQVVDNGAARAATTADIAATAVGAYWVRGYSPILHKYTAYSPFYCVAILYLKNGLTWQEVP